ncbi:MAG: hypothetical protein J7502_14915 [Flavisolibacter sp.]|nr:hypothetical protein [Flavisolibacter sp.]
MKRLAAIVFFAILLFNFYGYRLVISCMQANSDAWLEQKVDKNEYDHEQLISIKIKLDLPYYSSSPEYQRAYGSVILNGTSYQYVKRRVYKDTLELLCLANDAKTKIQSVKNEFTKALVDGQASIPKKHTPIKIFLPDYVQSFKVFSAQSLVYQKHDFSNASPDILSGYSLKHKKPPKHSEVSC